MGIYIGNVLWVLYNCNLKYWIILLLFIKIDRVMGLKMLYRYIE